MSYVVGGFFYSGFDGCEGVYFDIVFVSFLCWVWNGFVVVFIGFDIVLCVEVFVYYV